MTMRMAVQIHILVDTNIDTCVAISIVVIVVADIANGANGVSTSSNTTNITTVICSTKSIGVHWGECPWGYISRGQKTWSNSPRRKIGNTMRPVHGSATVLEGVRWNSLHCSTTDTNLR